MLKVGDIVVPHGILGYQFASGETRWVGKVTKVGSNTFEAKTLHCLIASRIGITECSLIMNLFHTVNEARERGIFSEREFKEMGL